MESCDELKDHFMLKGTPLVNGVYSIELPGTGVPVEVYCDLLTAGGGWILVGRSASAGAPGEFGWRSASGSLLDDSKPYSLGLDTHPFPFSEVLLGSRAGGKEWGQNVYVLGVPGDLMEQNTDWISGTDFSAAPQGACKPQGGPTMLQFVGRTGDDSVFFFRDLKGFNGTDYGLRHNKFETEYLNCEQGALLTGTQGMIMVR